MRARIIATILIAGLLVGVLSYLGFSTVVYRNAFLEADAQLQRAKSALGTNVMLYGTVRSFDSATHTLTVEVVNAYEAGGAPVTYNLPVLDDAYIGHQELAKNGEMYDSVSAITSADRTTLQDLPAGTRVKFLIRTGKGVASIMYLLFGNPL